MIPHWFYSAEDAIHFNLFFKVGLQHLEINVNKLLYEPHKFDLPPVNKIIVNIEMLENSWTIVTSGIYWKDPFGKLIEQEISLSCIIPLN